MSVKDSHEKPDEIEQLGRRDLEIARDMDAEVISYGEDIGWNTSDRAEDVFNVGLVRIRGHILLLEQGYTDDWDLSERFQNLYDLLNSEAKKAQSDLFREMSFVSRMQELETEAIRYALCTNDYGAAARVAIRCFVEDEFILLSTQIQGLLALMKWVDSNSSLQDAQRDILSQYLSTMCNRLKDNSNLLDDEGNGSGRKVLHEIRSSVADVFSKSVELASSQSKQEKLSGSTVFPEYVSWQIVIMEQF